MVPNLLLGVGMLIEILISTPQLCGENVSLKSLICYTARHNMTIRSSSCVPALFFFVLWNGTLGGDILNFSSRIYKLSNCWDDSDGALIIQVPAVIPLPVLVSQEHQEIILYRQQANSCNCCYYCCHCHCSYGCWSCHFADSCDYRDCGSAVWKG